MFHNKNTELYLLKYMCKNCVHLFLVKFTGVLVYKWFWPHMVKGSDLIFPYHFHVYTPGSNIPAWETSGWVTLTWYRSYYVAAYRVFKNVVVPCYLVKEEPSHSAPNCNCRSRSKQDNEVNYLSNWMFMIFLLPRVYVIIVVWCLRCIGCSHTYAYIILPLHHCLHALSGRLAARTETYKSLGTIITKYLY